jgi:hypothetical protein
MDRYRGLNRQNKVWGRDVAHRPFYSTCIKQNSKRMEINCEDWNSFTKNTTLNNVLYADDQFWTVKPEDELQIVANLLNKSSKNM